MIIKPPNGYLRHPNKTKLQYNFQQIGESDYISIVVFRQSDNQLFSFKPFIDRDFYENKIISNKSSIPIFRM